MSLKSTVLAFASQAMPRLSSRVLASSGYTLDLGKFGGLDGFSVWTTDTAERQDRAWQPIVEAAKAGDPREDVAALYDALNALGAGTEKVLEVGCGGGYNSEIIMSRFPLVDYHGVDIAESMVALGRAHYPARSFALASAYDLPYADDSFEIVIDGVALLHMLEWQRALGEYARVAKKHVVLHGLTLTDDSPTTIFAKYAYGQPTVELVFNRSEVLAACDSAGLQFVSAHEGLEYDLDEYIGIRSVSETWVMSVV